PSAPPSGYTNCSTTPGSSLRPATRYAATSGSPQVTGQVSRPSSARPPSRSTSSSSSPSPDRSSGLQPRGWKTHSPAPEYDSYPSLTSSPRSPPSAGAP